MKLGWRIVFFCFSLASVTAHADPIRAPHITVELLSEREAVAPHETQYIGIRFTPDPEWHVYWKNPGDSGLTPKVEWKFEPNEATASEFIYPAPERIQVGPIVNFGYHGDVLLLAKLNTEDLKPGSEIQINAQTRWLVCKQECVPGKASLSLKLPVVDSNAYAKIEGMHNPLFAKSISELPNRKKPGEDPSIRTIHEKMPDGSGKITFYLSTSDPALRQKISKARSQFFFFPESESGLEASSDQRSHKKSENDFVHEVRQKKYALIPALRGVLKVGDVAFETEEIFNPQAALALNPTPQHTDGNTSLPLMLLFALIGGLILNLMPCILPVLSIKVMELLNQSGENRAEIRKHGVVYTAGVLASFWVLAAVFLIFRSGGSSLGWGFQLQSPVFVGALAFLFFLMGLNLLGVFEIGTRVMGVGDGLTRKSGYAGSFFTGALTTIAATPCSAPFMGTALGFALTQPALISVSILTVLGFGLALPYLAFSFFPAASRILPKPGKWMLTLKRILALPLFATVIWLLTIVSAQLHPHSSTQMHGMWAPFSEERISKELAQGKTVLVNLTADWCVTCKVNEHVAFENAEVKKALSDPHVVPLMGDWTNGDPLITAYMMRFGRNSVPVYLLYKNGSKDPEILPQILTPSLVLKKLR